MLLGWGQCLFSFLFFFLLWQYPSIKFESLTQFSSVAQLRPTLCDPMNRSTPGLPVHHQLLESTQTHVHQVDDAMILSSVVPFSSCPQSFPASGSFPMSQHFISGGQSTGASGSVSVLSTHQFSLVQSLSRVRLFATP